MTDFLACPDPGGRSGRLERQLEQQKGNLEQLILQNEKLNQRDALRIATAKAALDTALAKLDDIEIQRKDEIAKFQQIKHGIETEQLDRTFQIDALKRKLKVTEAKIAFDGTGDQDAVTQSKTLSQQIAVQSIPDISDSVVVSSAFGSEQKAIAPAAGLSGIAAPGPLTRPLRLQITDSIAIEGSRR